MSSSAVSTGIRISARLPSPDAALWHRAVNCSSKIMGFSEWPDPFPAQGADMAKTAQSTANIAGKRAHIGAFPAFGLQYGVIGSAKSTRSSQWISTGRARIDRLSFAGEIVGALARDLHRGELRRHLLDVPVKHGSATIASRDGLWSLIATARPSASSVSRSSPQRTVKRYSLRPSITKGTVLVASPSAIGRRRKRADRECRHGPRVSPKLAAHRADSVASKSSRPACRE